MAMMAGHLLSSQREVVLVARISASGNPIAQPGDLEGRLEGVRVGAEGVRLVIDRVLP
jgi:cytochrome c-type biogenesis protein CcmH